MLYELPKLNYKYDALEPHIDSRTMEIHHTKHHQAYIDKLNAVLDKYPELSEKELPVLLEELHSFPIDDSDKKAIYDNGGGHLNHSLFWEIMDPNAEKNERLEEVIVEQFGSISEMKNEFNQTAMSRFGSGWAWLVRDAENTLHIYSTANQDSPHVNGHTPIIGLDVWEHAYYLSYENRRMDYIDAWWNTVKII